MFRDKDTKKKKLGKGCFYLLPFALCLGSSPAWSVPLRDWQYDPTANQLEVTVKGGVKPRYFLMAQPARIILDLPETEVGSVQTQQTYTGAVRQVRVSQFQPGLTRIVLELSPGTVLMREQAKLQPVGNDGKAISQRWVLRPLIASASPASAAKIEATSSSASSPVPATQTPPVPNPPSPSAEAVPETENSSLPKADNSPPQVSNAVTDKPIDIVVSRPSSSTRSLAVAPASTSLPPATVPTAVAPSSIAPTPPTPDLFPPGIAPATPVSEVTPSVKPLSIQAEAATSQGAVSASERSSKLSASAQPSSSSTGLQLPAVNPSLSIPDSLPPVTAPDAPPTAPTVTVPPLSPSPRSLPEIEEPSAVNSTATVKVPPLQPAAAPMQARPQSGTIEFGQPLPTLPTLEQTALANGASSLPAQSPALLSNNAALLPAGTLLTLQYSGTQALSLQAGQPRQEVLVLPAALRDAAGNLMAPEGTTILGKFETSSSGSRFVAQSISLGGQNRAIVAQSEILGGTRKVSENRLFRNSGIGALAGAILGGLSGGNVVGGAAAGAALTYVTSPKPATIQPGQIIRVQLTEDFRE